MRVYITSVGEPTTELCKWALERQGFNVFLLQDKTSLWSKLKQIYFDANEDFLRVDADIIVNRNMTPDLLNELGQDQTIWWWQFITFDWYKQDITHSMAYIKREALPALRDNINRFKQDIRPETQVSRIKELENPRRMETYQDRIAGLHGYGIQDLTPVRHLKAQRNQLDNYDFELAERLNLL